MKQKEWKQMTSLLWKSCSWWGNYLCWSCTATFHILPLDGCWLLSCEVNKFTEKCSAKDEYSFGFYKKNIKYKKCYILLLMILLSFYISKLGCWINSQDDTRIARNEGAFISQLPKEKLTNLHFFNFH